MPANTDTGDGELCKVLDDFGTRILKLQGTVIGADLQEEIERIITDALAKLKAREALITADLAWCLGKLRGMGSPAEHLEDKYQLAAKDKENT